MLLYNINANYMYVYYKLSLHQTELPIIYIDYNQY